MYHMWRLQSKFLDRIKQCYHKKMPELRFTQMMDRPTHTQGGIIDHLYIHRPNSYIDIKITCCVIAAFYTDHFGVNITFFKEEDEFIHIKSSVPDHLIEPEDIDDLQNRKRKICRHC